MRSHFACLGVVVCFVLFATAFGAANPPVATTSTQAAAAIQSAIAALSGSTAINDVTLSGTAEWIAGSDDETGTVAYKAVPSANQLALSLSNGPRTEIRSTADLTGSWSGPDAVSHKMAYHNLLTDRGWFPLFTLSSIASSSASVLTYVGLETRNGISVIHLSASQSLPNATSIDPTLFQPQWSPENRPCAVTSKPAM